MSNLFHCIIDFYMSTKITLLKNVYEGSYTILQNGHVLYNLFILKNTIINVLITLKIDNNKNNVNLINKLKISYNKYNNLYRDLNKVELFKEFCSQPFISDNRINIIDKIPKIHIHTEIVDTNLFQKVTNKCLYHKEIIKNASKVNIQHKKKIKELLLIIKDKNRVIKNKQECIRRRNHFVSNLKLSKNIENPKSKIIKLLKKRISRLLKINKDKINQSRCLDSKIVYIENVEYKVEDLDMNKTHKHFSVNMRMLAYTCLKNSGIPDIIQNCVKLFNINVNNIPHRSTIENMSLELGILADYITAEFMIQNKNLTLGFDATTQGVHVNAVNINSKDKGYLVSLEELAGGTADDYTDHIYKSINHIAYIYSYLKN